jgi:hypothetical protein
MYFSSIPSPYANDMYDQTPHVIDQIAGIDENFPQSDDMDANSPILYIFLLMSSSFSPLFHILFNQYALIQVRYCVIELQLHVQNM